MTLEQWAILLGPSFSLAALGVLARVSFIHGKMSTKLDGVIDDVAEIKKAIGNGEPGLFVRKEVLEPIAADILRLRERTHNQSDTLQEHDGRLTVVEHEVAHLRG